MNSKMRKVRIKKSRPRSALPFHPLKKPMLLAIAVARKGIQCGQSPFGSVIVQGSEVLAATHNQVWATSDPTAHAEITCIRMASQQNSRIDLSDCVLYSTCEPCPMCLAACHWAKITRVVYGATISHAQQAGFSELTIPGEKMVSLGGSPLLLTSGFMAKQCATLFSEWKRFNGSRAY